MYSCLLSPPPSFCISPSLHLLMFYPLSHSLFLFPVLFSLPLSLSLSLSLSFPLCLPFFLSPSASPCLIPIVSVSHFTTLPAISSTLLSPFVSLPPILPLSIFLLYPNVYPLYVFPALCLVFTSIFSALSFPPILTLPLCLCHLALVFSLVSSNLSICLFPSTPSLLLYTSCLCGHCTVSLPSQHTVSPLQPTCQVAITNLPCCLVIFLAPTSFKT